MKRKLRNEDEEEKLQATKEIKRDKKECVINERVSK